MNIPTDKAIGGYSIYLSLSRASMQPDRLSTVIVKLISVTRLPVSALKIEPLVYD